MSSRLALVVDEALFSEILTISEEDQQWLSAASNTFYRMKRLAKANTWEEDFFIFLTGDSAIRDIITLHFYNKYFVHNMSGVLDEQFLEDIVFIRSFLNFHNYSFFVSIIDRFPVSVENYEDFGTS